MAKKETHTVWIRVDVATDEDSPAGRMDDVLDDDRFTELLSDYDLKASLTLCDNTPEAINRAAGEAPVPLETDDEDEDEDSDAMHAEPCDECNGMRWPQELHEKHCSLYDIHPPTNVMILPDGTRYEGTLRTDDDGKPKVSIASCNTCHFAWNEELSTSLTPPPSGRCPNEYGH